MQRLTETCSKADELNHWRKFINQLPPCSYLALYLQDSIPMMEDAMRNDMSCEALSDLRKQRATAQADVNDIRTLLAELRAQRDTLKREIDGMKRDAARLRDSFDEAKSAARILLRLAEDAHAKGVHVILKAIA